MQIPTPSKISPLTVLQGLVVSSGLGAFLGGMAGLIFGMTGDVTTGVVIAGALAGPVARGASFYTYRSRHRDAWEEMLLKKGFKATGEDSYALEYEGETLLVTLDTSVVQTPVGDSECIVLTHPFIPNELAIKRANHRQVGLDSRFTYPIEISGTPASKVLLERPSTYEAIEHIAGHKAAVYVEDGRVRMPMIVCSDNHHPDVIDREYEQLLSFATRLMSPEHKVPEQLFELIESAPSLRVAKDAFSVLQSDYSQALEQAQLWERALNSSVERARITAVWASSNQGGKESWRALSLQVAQQILHDQAADVEHRTLAAELLPKVVSRGDAIESLLSVLVPTNPPGILLAALEGLVALDAFSKDFCPERQLCDLLYLYPSQIIVLVVSVLGLHGGHFSVGPLKALGRRRMDVRGEIRAAVQAIVERSGPSERGLLSLAEPEGGEVTMVDASVGEISLMDMPAADTEPSA